VTTFIYLESFKKKVITLHNFAPGTTLDATPTYTISLDPSKENNDLTILVILRNRGYDYFLPTSFVGDANFLVYSTRNAMAPPPDSSLVNASNKGLVAGSKRNGMRTLRRRK